MGRPERPWLLWLGAIPLAVEAMPLLVASILRILVHRPDPIRGPGFSVTRRVSLESRTRGTL